MHPSTTTPYPHLLTMLKEAMSKTTAGIYIRLRTTGKLFNLQRQQRSRFIKPYLPHFCIAAKRGFSTEDLKALESFHTAMYHSTDQSAGHDS